MRFHIIHEPASMRFVILHLGSFGIIWDHLGDLKSHFLRRQSSHQYLVLTGHLRHGAKDCGLVQHRGPGFTEKLRSIAADEAGS
jgi:hypothetical protein